MPMGVIYRSGRNVRKRGRPKKFKRATALNVDQKQDKQIMRIKQQIREINSAQELKFLSWYSAGLTLVANTPQMVSLVGCQRGDQFDQREGAQIRPTSCQFRMIVNGTTSNTSTNFVRFLLLWDSQPNNAMPTASEVLSIATITQYIVAPYAHSTQKRFKILDDQILRESPDVVQVTSSGITQNTLGTSTYYSRKIPLSRTVKYDAGNAGDVTDIESNNLIAFFVSYNSNVNVLYGFRVFFKDD